MRLISDSRKEAQTHLLVVVIKKYILATHLGTWLKSDSWHRATIRGTVKSRKGFLEGTCPACFVAVFTAGRLGTECLLEILTPDR